MFAGVNPGALYLLKPREVVDSVGDEFRIRSR